MVWWDVNVPRWNQNLDGGLVELPTKCVFGKCLVKSLVLTMSIEVNKIGFLEFRSKDNVLDETCYLCFRLHSLPIVQPLHNGMDGGIWKRPVCVTSTDTVG